MRLVILFWCFLLLFPLVLAHEGDEETQELQRIGGVNDMRVVSPFFHLSQGRWLTALAFFTFWFVLLRGLYTFALLILGRSVRDQEQD